MCFCVSHTVHLLRTHHVLSCAANRCEVCRELVPAEYDVEQQYKDQVGVCVCVCVWTGGAGAGRGTAVIGEK